MRTKRSSHSRDYPPLLVTTAAAFCSGRSLALGNMVLEHGHGCAATGGSTTKNALIERVTPNRVQLMMNRARAILVSVIPALMLLVSLDCFSDSFSYCGREDSGCSLSSTGHCNHGQPTTDNAFDQAVYRLSRRLNAQPGSDGACSPAALAFSQSAPLRSTDCSPAVPPTNPRLAQVWQFHWRTASEPRAPSSVS